MECEKYFCKKTETMIKFSKRQFSGEISQISKMISHKTLYVKKGVWYEYDNVLKMGP